MNDFGVNPGDVLAEKYQLDELLGAGGMGSVWSAHHLTLGSEVAVKVLKPHVASNETSRMRFVREAKAAAALRSPHVVQILDYGTHDGTVFITMEKMEGEELGDRLKRQKRLPPEDVYRILNHVGRALQKAHEMGIVHRDLKPANIFLIQNDDEFIAKVLDFGIAKASTTLEATDSPQTKTGVLLGTPYYVSPEQAQGSTAVDARSDLWALGVIAYECLCGRRPFAEESLVKLLFQICGSDPPAPSTVCQVPAGFDEWFSKSVSKLPESRFQSAKELVASLKPILVPIGVASATDMLTPSNLGALMQHVIPKPDQVSQPGQQAAAAPDEANDPSDELEGQTAGFGGSSPGTLEAIVQGTQQRRRKTFGAVMTVAALGLAAAGYVLTGSSSDSTPSTSSESASTKSESASTKDGVGSDATPPPAHAASAARGQEQADAGEAEQPPGQTPDGDETKPDEGVAASSASAEKAATKPPSKPRYKRPVPKKKVVKKPAPPQPPPKKRSEDLNPLGL